MIIKILKPKIKIKKEKNNQSWREVNNYFILRIKNKQIFKQIDYRKLLLSILFLIAKRKLKNRQSVKILANKNHNLLILSWICL